MGASTRRRSAGATTASRKKADARLDDITNGKGMGGETTTSKGARPSRKSIGGPSTVAPVEKRVTRSSRSTAKKATETTTAKSTKAKNSAKVVVGLALEERFNDVVDDVPAGKKRKALGVIEEKQPKRETRARAATRKGDGASDSDDVPRARSHAFCFFFESRAPARAPRTRATDASDVPFDLNRREEAREEGPTRGHRPHVRREARIRPRCASASVHPSSSSSSSRLNRRVCRCLQQGKSRSDRRSRVF